MLSGTVTLIEGAPGPATPAPDATANSHAGYYTFPPGHGQFEVFWDDAEPGWYWWPCFPGCLPDGEQAGPFATSRLAWADARGEG